MLFEDAHEAHLGYMLTGIRIVRSLTVGMPSVRTAPPGCGISTFNTRLGS